MKTAEEWANGPWPLYNDREGWVLRIREIQRDAIESTRSKALLNKGAPFVAGSDTSRAAADSLRNLSGMRLDVLNWFKTQPRGATCDEAEVSMGLSHQTCSARVRDLVKMELLRASGEKRKTRSGRLARVYRAVES